MDVGDKKACEEFFLSCPPPADLAEVGEKTREFITRHKDGRPVVLITSGGTIAPLEKNTVRFIDNFSSGQRGASSAENFLSTGYAVIFLHRGSSLKPFQRHFKDDNVLDWFTVTEEQDGECSVALSCGSALKSRLSTIVSAYQQCKRDQTLLCLPFKTIFEYLFYLREVSLHLGQGMAYLAAAVADFYVPYASMSEHKIQSSGPLGANFSCTPKMLRLLTKKWAPNAFVVTFKLETDSEILLDKAKTALINYGHQAVVANVLGCHRTMVTIISRATDMRSPDDGMQCGGRGQAGGCRSLCESGEQLWEALEIRLSKEDMAKNIELESLIVQYLVTRHTKYNTV